MVTISYSQVVKIPYTSSPVTVIVSSSIFGPDYGPSASDPLFGLVVCFVSNGEDGSAGEARILRGTTHYKSNPDTLIFTSNSNADTLWVFALNTVRSEKPYYLGEYNVNVNGINYVVDTSNVIYFMDINNLTSASEFNYELPKNFHLRQNYPNPFNPSTTIEYQVSKQMNVKIDIYNSNGELIKELLDEEKNDGNYSVVWNGRDDKGNLVASGTYLYQIQTGDFVQEKKMILLK